MKILVFDDNQIHRKAAETQLNGHNLTTVGTYDEAQKALTEQFDKDKFEMLVKERLGEYKPLSKDTDEKVRNEHYLSRYNAEKKISEECTTNPEFDAVLTDLMVLPSSQAQADKIRFANQEMPLGSIIALLAIAQGIKRVAIVTDTNHHQHPASAALDCFRHLESKCEGVKIICDDNSFACVNKETMEIVDHSHANHVYVKDWAEILRRLNK